jgi:hypothetical protein
LRVTVRAAPRATFTLADVAATEPLELARVAEQDSGLPRSAATGVKVRAVAPFCAVPLTSQRIAVVVALSARASGRCSATGRCMS